MVGPRSTAVRLFLFSQTRPWRSGRVMLLIPSCCPNPKRRIETEPKHQDSTDRLSEAPGFFMQFAMLHGHGARRPLFICARRPKTCFSCIYIVVACAEHQPRDKQSQNSHAILSH